MNNLPEYIWIVVAIALLRLEPDRVWTLLRLALGREIGREITSTSSSPDKKDNTPNTDVNRTIALLQNQLKEQTEELGKLILQNKKQARYNAGVALGFLVVAIVEVFF